MSKVTYIITPENAPREMINRACNYLRLDGIPLCPNVAFSYLEKEDWLRETLGLELMKLCDHVVVFADEVTEIMIAEIKKAQELNLPIKFYDADRNAINYDALVINHRIGPGYRKMIVEAHGDTCCPCCGEVREKPEKSSTEKQKDKLAETMTANATTSSDKAAPATKKKTSPLQRLFGKAR